MYLTDKEIIDIVKKYLEDDNQDYALMIDGNWGSGKTYFVKNKIMHIYDENKEFAKKFIYVSTYGVKDYSELNNKIYNSTISQFMPNKLKKVYKVAKKGISSIYDIIKIFKELPNIPKDSVKNLIEIIQKFNEKKYILVFDDIERSNMPINELLGYINDFVEHNQMKVILVANENELYKKKIYSDIELKYMVAANNNLDIPLERKKDSLFFPNSQENKNGQNNINIDALNQRVEKIFGEDILYSQIKEKLIGRTVHYCPNIDDIMVDLIHS